jgi:hypothetical protein
VLPDAAREVARTATDLEFMYLPEAIRGDVSFVRRSRLADCCGQANLLMIEALARHYPARRSFGYITAPPFATEHHWAELMVGGVWVPVDPVLIRKMVYWGALDAELWHPYRSIGSIVTRVSDQAVAPITHNGERVPAMLPVRLLSDGR